MQQRDEGFQQSDEDRLGSKLNHNINQNQLLNTFFVMPQAKPLLSKTFIDANKAKVLIKQIDIYQQPKQLLTSNVNKEVFSQDKPHNAKPPNVQNMLSTTIWEKYVLSQSFTLIYLKYYKENLEQLQKKSFKKYKLQLQKICNYQTQLFSAYLVDLAFLNEEGSYLLRNLKPNSFQQQQQRPYQFPSLNIAFDSRFQSGNLFAVFSKKNNLNSYEQFDLILQSDINTKGYSNWFYFNVKCKKKTTLKLNLVNMQKNHSLFAQGMKIAVFSMKKFKNQKIEWHRDGYNYSFYRNELRKNNENQITYNTLSFFYDLKYDEDIVYLAANIPYSYTKMLSYIEYVQRIAKLNSSIYLKKQTIATSISQNGCPVITLTWKRQKRKDQKKKRKKIIGVIARQHPSQTVSSYVMEGFLNSLVYLNSQGSVDLLQNYIFKIVPMVNIDGVIYGNSRCDIIGTDINRKWTRNPNKFLYPIVSNVKNMFSKLIQQQYEIDYFIDLHGHSRKMGAFIYGCKTIDQVQSRQLSWMLSKLNSKFLFEQCLFGISQYKKQTARGVMCDIVTKKKSMTLQTSFYGYKSISSRHFDIKDLQKIGGSLVDSIYADCSKDPKLFNWQTLKSQVRQAIDQLQNRAKQGKTHGQSQSSFGSDSNPQQDEMTQKQKAEHYLDPTTALKIGLNDLKIVKKKSNSREKLQLQNERKNSYEMIIDGFRSKIDLPNNNVQNLIQSKQFIQQNLVEKNLKQRAFIIRQSKSTTKILPFKFSQRLDKQMSLQKKTRKSVQIFLKRPQKLSIPQLPKVQTKSNFWSNLKKEYEVLLVQRKLGGKSTIK